MTGLLGAALLTGLAGGVHCVGMCGGFASATAARGGAGPWHLGRLATYGLLGALAGSIGVSLPGPAWLPAALAGALVLFFALRLAGLLPGGLHLPLPRPLLTLAARFARGRGRGSRLGLGLLTGLLPCGLVYAGLALALAAPGPLWGALVMVSFGLGTIPLLAGLAGLVRRATAQSLGRRRALATLIALVGLGSVSMRTAPPLVPTAAAETAAEPAPAEALVAPAELLAHPPGCPMAPEASGAPADPEIP